MIKIITDTAVSLPPDLIEQHDITMLGGYIMFGAERFADYYEITNEEFYHKLKTSPHHPENVDPTPDEFRVIYRAAVMRYPGVPILSIHCTGKLSTTVQSARVAAAAFPDANIRIFDTESVGAAQGLMVLEAGRMSQAGASIDEILQRLQFIRSKMQVFFTLDTLDFVARSGRVDQISRMFGNLFEIKPILTLREGAVEPYGQERTRLRAIESLLEMVTTGAGPNSNAHVGVMHAACENEGRALGDRIRRAISPEVHLVTELGPGVGVSAGPGALGVCWYVPPRS
jgi:DegV family protein with EDD domain